MKPYTHRVWLGLIALGMGVLLGCPRLDTTSVPTPNPDQRPDLALHIIIPKVNSRTVYAGEAVQKISFTDTIQDVTLTQVQGHSLFLIKVNTSPNWVSADKTGYGYPLEGVPSQAVGSVLQGVGSPQTLTESGRFILGDQTITRYDHPGAQAFARNPPLVVINTSSPQENRYGDIPEPAFVVASLGDTGDFWVKDANGTWIQIPAVLRVISDHSKVWVAAANYNNSSAYNKRDNQLTQIQVEAMAKKFDQIYQYETPLFGYEYGGGLPSTDPNYGGVDKDPAVHILVYDIDYDYKASQTGGVFGFFWEKDWYDQAALDRSQSRLKTNRKELFYIDAFFADAYPDAIYSTLAHEFQHMIHFNTKKLQRGQTSETWYDEMLSLLAEDVIAPTIGVPPTNEHHPIPSRIPTFLDRYNATGLTQWLTGDEALISYANIYAFGAYLARNYGGADLIKAIMENNTSNLSSLNEALLASAAVSFTQVLSRYGEAFIYSGAHKPKGTLSFDTTVTNEVNQHTYTFTGFDLWTIHDAWRGYDPIPYTYTGPLIWDGNYRFAMPGYSVLVQSLDAWQEVKTDTVHIRFQKPADAHIDLYLMIR